MVKVKISYFYKVRFFTPDMIPLSTAMWDPKWFSNHGSAYFDKNGVINGYKIPPLVPGAGCNNLCRGAQSCTQTPDMCAFLRKYREQLDAFGFDKLMLILQDISDTLQQDLLSGVKPTLVLMVYEPPYKPCSERVPLKAWFADHGYDLEEVE